MKPRSLAHLLLILLLMATPHLTQTTQPSATQAQAQTQTLNPTILDPDKQHYTFKNEQPLLIDNFENYTIGDFPDEGGWILEDYGQGANLQTIVESPAIGGKSLQLAGAPGRPAAIAHNLPPTSRSTLYIDISIYIEEPTGDSTTQITINNPGITIEIRPGTITINNNTLYVIINKGWNRIALTTTHTGDTILTINNKQTTTKITPTPTTQTNNKITIKTNTKIYIDNVHIKQTTPYQLWLKALDGEVYSVAWSPDGAKIAAGTIWYYLYMFYLPSVVFTYGGGVLSVIGSVASDTVFCWSIDDGFSTCTQSAELAYVFSDTGWHLVNLSIRAGGVDVYWVAGWIYSSTTTTTSTTTSSTSTPTPTTTTTPTTTITTTEITTTTETTTETSSKTDTTTVTITRTSTVTSVSVSPTTVYSTITVTDTVISPTTTTSIITNTITTTTTSTKTSVTTSILRLTDTITTTVTSMVTETSVLLSTVTSIVTSLYTSVVTETVSWVLVEPGRALGIAAAMIIVSLVLARFLVRR